MADHTILWLRPDGGLAPLHGKGSVEHTVSHLGATRAAVYGKAVGMGREAAARLGQHRLTGAAHIEVVAPPVTELDAYVALRDSDPGGMLGEDRSAASIEFGWTQTTGFGGKPLKTPRHHDGLHILQRTMNAAARRYGGNR
jgi:hypothetical protein